MIVVAGHITVEPRQRESYLAGCVSIVEQAREKSGCLDFAITADLIDPDRITIFERWEVASGPRSPPQRGRPQRRARRGDALGVGSRLRHHQRAALLRERHSMNRQRGPRHDR